jgi:hypothetical protein
MATASKDSSGSGSKLSTRLVEVTDLEGTGLSDITSGAATVYSVDINNTLGAITYFRMHDSGAPTFGSTDADVLIPVAASTRSSWIIAQGLSFGTGISLQASAAAGPGGTGALSAGPTVLMLTA